MKRTLMIAAFAAGGLLIAEAAFAHAMLVKAIPAVGGTVSNSPADIRITFSEAIEPRFSGIVVTTGEGREVETGTVGVDPGDHATLVVALKSRLPPGAFKVTWHVVSVDTHKTQGSFSFTVKP